MAAAAAALCALRTGPMRNVIWRAMNPKINLPDETRKNTTGDNLLSISYYERTSKAACHMEDLRRCSPSRSRSTSRSRQQVRSSSRGRFGDRCPEERSPAVLHVDARGRTLQHEAMDVQMAASSYRMHTAALEATALFSETLFRASRKFHRAKRKKMRERYLSPFRRNLSYSESGKHKIDAPACSHRC